MRSRQYPVAAHSATSSQPGEAGPCTAHLLLDVSDVAGGMPFTDGAQASAQGTWGARERPSGPEPHRQMFRE